MRSRGRPGVRFRYLLLGAAVALVAACDGGPTEPKTPNGRYALSTVNGRTPPATIYSDSGYTVAVVSGDIDLRDDGRFLWVVTTRETVDAFPSTYVDSASGTWTKTTGDVIALVAQGDTAKAAWSNRQLTFDQPDGTGKVIKLVYARR